MAPVAIPLEEQDVLPIGPAYRRCRSVRVLRSVDTVVYEGASRTNGTPERLFERAFFTSGDYRVLYRPGELRREDLDGSHAVVWTGVPEDAVAIVYEVPFRRCRRITLRRPVSVTYRYEKPRGEESLLLMQAGRIFTDEGAHLYYRPGEIREVILTPGPYYGLGRTHEGFVEGDLAIDYLGTEEVLEPSVPTAPARAAPQVSSPSSSPAVTFQGKDLAAVQRILERERDRAVGALEALGDANGAVSDAIRARTEHDLGDALSLLHALPGPEPTSVLSFAWLRFLSGHWTREAPTEPGVYPTCPLNCPAGKSMPTVTAVAHAGGVRLLDEWRGWFWSEPLPQLPHPPDWNPF
jgi:hypothetical protein